MHGKRKSASSTSTKQQPMLASSSPSSVTRNDNPARKLADSAYLLWRNDYNDLMQLGRYLTWTESDSTQRFPGIHEPPQWLRCRLSSARD